MMKSRKMVLMMMWRMIMMDDRVEYRVSSCQVSKFAMIRSIFIVFPFHLVSIWRWFRSKKR